MLEESPLVVVQDKLAEVEPSTSLCASVETSHVADIREGVPKLEGTLKHVRVRVPTCLDGANENLTVQVLILGSICEGGADVRTVPYLVGEDDNL